jgi:hypothetical protein
VKQAADIARVIRAFPNKPVALYARGDNAALAAAYAITQSPDLSWYILRDGFVASASSSTGHNRCKLLPAQERR